MSPTESEIARADREFAAWMRANLDHAAEHFGLSALGEPVYGWRLLSIGAPAFGADGRYWLRVVTEEPRWAHGDRWRGNTDANAVTGIRKPRVLDTHEWDIPGIRRQRAELMTHLAGQPCGGEDALHEEIQLPDSWWRELRSGLDHLATIPTEREHKNAAEVAERLERVGAHHGVRRWESAGRWETVHGDLHWTNLLCPEFGLLDWTLWGRGPVGTDAATLYCYSLLAPRTAETVWRTFADVLETPNGEIALLHVAARLLRRVEIGDHPELAAPLRELIRRIRSLSRSTEAES
ncbi:hypothetical protein SAMN04487819_11083 [Actinopolyspora alba]|uniref:Phosphotransferase enzyme family protein n=1 Tax=Actinopolyspora alba TaxID=673379 RepID=A0A1I1Z5R7_9ACTN|nr:hypothetical protein [Actinopolyspora alba]SFE27126.1 hypothetical protein SAMN04487819_11083 [Actinopolyspora alba]